MRKLLFLWILLTPLLTQAGDLREISRWQIGRIEFTLAQDLQAPCRLHVYRYDLEKGRQLLTHRASDLHYFNIEMQRQNGQAFLHWVLDLPENPTTPEERYRSWQLNSLIRNGYRQINAAWRQLGNSIQRRERESKVAEIARALAAQNKNGAFGQFFQSNYREIYFLYGAERFRFLPAQGFSVPLKTTAQAQRIAGLLASIRSRQCIR